MPGDLSGIDLVRSLKKAGHATKFIIYSSYAQPALVFAALDAGGQGFQSKAESLDRVLHGCLAVAAADCWWFSEDVQAVVNAKHMGPTRNELTPKEHQVQTLVALGYENLNIAARLAISENTVKNHYKSIYRKRSVSGRVGAALWAWREGLVQEAAVPAISCSNN